MRRTNRCAIATRWMRLDRWAAMAAIVLAAAALATGGSARAAGLLAPTDESLPPFRITDHLVDVEIDSGIARTTLKQSFRNDTKQRLEATYIFPLPEDADLTDFQMSFNGQMVKGEVLPANEALREYERIVRQARDPGLIEFIGHRLLRMRVFPVEPESDTTITVNYQQICPSMGGMKAYHYPLRTRQAAGQAYGTVRFNVELETDAPLKTVWSPSHTVEVVRDGEEKALVAYEAKGASLVDDFLLLYETDASDLGLSTLAYKPSEDEPGHFVMVLTPKQLWPQEDREAQDVVFVLDTSGSMSGEKIEQAKNALGYCIDRLDKNDRFTIVRFSTGFDTWSDAPKAATPEARREAREWFMQFPASGGTNIADTMAEVVRIEQARMTEADQSRRSTPVRVSLPPFVVVFLTDGNGNRNPDEIMNMLQASAGDKSTGQRMRIFPFGIGHDVNTLLLDRLANGYRGEPTYVQPGESLELVLGDYFNVISQPVLTDLRLVLPEAGITDRFPAQLQDLYHGRQLVLAGQFSEPGTGMVTLHAKRKGEDVFFSWENVALQHTEGASYVPTIWAGRKIAYLIDQIRLHGESSEMVEEVIALGTRHGIQTPYSSWFVNPEQFGQTDVAQRRMRAQQNFQRNSQIPGSRRSAPARGGGLGAGGGAGIFGDPAADSAIPMEEAQRAVTAGTGRAANVIAQSQTMNRGRASSAEGRVQWQDQVAVNVNGRNYQRLGTVLVDEELGEDTPVATIRFGSDAYFELAMNRADLRPLLAQNAENLVLVSENQAVLILTDEGEEKLSEELRQEIGRVER